jgi:hypothetical protein
MGAAYAPAVGTRSCVEGYCTLLSADQAARRLRERVRFIPHVRWDHPQRYQPTNQGLRLACFCSRVYLRVLRPGLAQALAPTPPADPALRPAFDALTVAIDQFLEEAGCAA